MSEMPIIDQRYLQLDRWIVGTSIPAEHLRGARLHHVMDHMRQSMLLKLEKDVFREHLLADTTRLPVRGEIVTDDVPHHVMVELPQPWWRRILRLPPRHRWCPVVGNAVLANAGDRIIVGGDVTVRADYFATFPEFEPPPNLGTVVYQQQLHADDVIWRKP